MYFTVYKITNIITGKYYIGKHQTNNLDDGYMGSGKYLRYSINKHGIENFTKEILFIFETIQEMNEKEKELVVVSEETYNLKEGGEGGFDYLNNQFSANSEYREYWLSKLSTPWNKGIKFGPHPEEQNKKRSETLKEHWKQNGHNRTGVEPWNKGLVGKQIAWNKGTSTLKASCRYCKKEVDVLNLKRWHGENCKSLR